VAGRGSQRLGEAGPRRTGLVAVAFGLVSAAILGGVVVWASRSSTADTDGRPTVAIVGDSITDQGESVLTSDLSEEWRLRIEGASGSTIAEQLKAADALGGRDPQQVIVNLGTNDVMNGDDLDQSAAALRQIVAAFPHAACIHLVTINQGIVLGGVSFAPRSAQLNRAMTEIAADDPRVEVLDWSRVVGADDAVDHSEGPLLRDTVHPTTSGQHVLARMYAEALTGCPAGG
jgi:lysophospholipase L1-like esterase